MKLKYSVFGLGLMLVSVLTQAQTRLLTFEEAVATSLQNNYDIQLSRNDSTLAALNNSYANYAFLPRLNAGGAYIHNATNQRQELASGAKRGGDVKSNNLQASLNLDWTLFDGFKMFITKKRLGELVELGEIQIKAQVVTTVADVMRVYYDIVRQEQLQRAMDEQMQLSEERLKIAQYKFDIGTGAKPDVLQAQIDMNAQRSALLTQQSNIGNLKEQ